MNANTDQTANPDASYRGPIVALTLAVLLRIEPFIPRLAFKVAYDTCFLGYRFFLRFKYSFKRLSSNSQSREMAKIVHRVMPHSLVGSAGLEATYKLTKETIEKGIEGDFIECGVAQGGCAALIANVARIANNPRHLWLFDSYEGLPEPTEKDYDGLKTGRHVRPLPKGSCLGTIEQVNNLLFDIFKYDRKNITMVKGWFQDSLPITKDKISKIAILRLDGDWYESTMVCLDQLYEKVSVGGYVILDDYYSCYGCQKATGEYLSKIGKEFPIVADGRGGAYFKKAS